MGAKVKLPQGSVGSEFLVEEKVDFRPDNRYVLCWDPKNAVYESVSEIVFNQRLTSVRRSTEDPSLLVLNLCEIALEEETIAERVLVAKESDYLGVEPGKKQQYIRIFKLKDDPNGPYGIGVADTDDSDQWKVIDWAPSVEEAVRQREKIIRMDAPLVYYIRANSKKSKR